MKGLLQKDLYMIWRYGRVLLLISAFFLVMGFLEEGNIFFIIYPVLFAGILPVTLISYEERDGWNKLCDALPLSRKTVVNERYLMTLLCLLALYLITLAVQAAVLIPKGRAAELRQLACLLPLVGLTAPSLMIPVTFRWGVEKGRLVYYVFIGAATVAMSQLSADWFSRGPSKIAGLGLWALSLIAAGVFALSWLLSLRIYQRREL